MFKASLAYLRGGGGGAQHVCATLPEKKKKCIRLRDFYLYLGPQNDATIKCLHTSINVTIMAHSYGSLK